MDEVDKSGQGVDDSGRDQNQEMKKQFREHYLEIRRKLNSERRKGAAGALTESCAELLRKEPCVLSFASFGDEIDLGQLNQKLAAERRLLLPCRVGDRLEIYHVENFTPASKEKLWEPVPEKNMRVPFEEISCVLVPGLCFDERGYRLGYGKGHYDRLLAKLKTTVTYGIGFKEQLCKEHLPVELFDMPVKELLLF